MHNHPSFKPAQRNKEDFYSGAVFNKTNSFIYENQIQKLYFKKEIVRNGVLFLASQQIIANSCAARKQ